MKPQSPWGLHWFRRDLRIPGNLALRKNWSSFQGRTLGVFCFDSEFLKRDDFSHHRFAFFLKTLNELRKDLRSQGGDLLIVDSQPLKAFEKIFYFLKKNNHELPTLVTWNRDYEPFARQRDEKVENYLKSTGIGVHTERDHLFFEPEEIKKGANGFYQVYSPFGRQWFERFNSELGRQRLRQQKSGKPYYERENRKDDLFQMSWKEWISLKDFPFHDSLDEFHSANKKNVSIPIPEAGFFSAYERWNEFLPKLNQYKKDRDFPALAGTSRLSMFFKNGSLSVGQVFSDLDDGKPWNWKQDSGKNQFAKELVWREFYYSILYHQPRVETESFLPQYRDLPWENNSSFFERWKDGTTGFPIVDAGMRELRTTGWMHNRVRMIVASFLTKDLLIDWRWGENHFMKELLDGDLACNNGGWQWAASTGCDPQPYFRIFNPWLQGKKFDPDGDYIKKFVPELSEAPAGALHAEDSDRSSWKYPAPMVNHSEQRQKALLLYRPSKSF